MRKLFLLLFLVATATCYGQDSIPKQPKVDRDSVVKLDAEKVCIRLIGTTKDSLALYMKGTKRVDTGSECSEIYYIYSSRENKNIPVEFFYMEDYRLKDGKLRMWKAEFVSRKSPYYKTSDLKTAFWIEWIRKPK
jgi:hypothetical protein